MSRFYILIKRDHQTICNGILFNFHCFGCVETRYLQEAEIKAKELIGEAVLMVTPDFNYARRLLFGEKLEGVFDLDKPSRLRKYHGNRT